jgi:uncharacterized protein (TIGR01777 family)
MLLGVTGSSGFVGSALRRAAERRGWTIARLTRLPAPAEIEGLDAVVHLAGESIDGRWTPAKKRAIAGSRIDGTRHLVDAIAKTAAPPRTLVSASAVGWYGDRAMQPLDESSAPGEGFLADVCGEWEAAAMRAGQHGTRVAVLRTGIALGDGGALPKMAAPFRFGGGGPLGSGRQFVPWIHVDDLAEMYLTAVEQARSGPYNAVAPDYATSARLAQAIGAALLRPLFAYAPAPALRLVLGEFAGTLLASQLVLPRRAQDAGFVWQHPRLEPAIQSILAPQRSSRLVRTLQREQLVAAPLDDVFEFFAQARNLESITPPSLRFALRSPDGITHDGTRISYRLRLHGVPFGWETLIAKWQPPNAFIDVQLRGPYALWEHRHTFESRAAVTLMRDHVDYVLPFHPLSALLERFVRRDVEAIFDFRARRIGERFGAL